MNDQMNQSPEEGPLGSCAYSSEIQEKAFGQG